MRRLVLTSGCWFLTWALLHAQAPAPVAREVLDAAISVIKTEALRKDALAWDVVEPRARALAAGATKSSDVYPAIRYLLEQLGDHHSRLTVPTQTAAFLSGGAQNPALEAHDLPGRVGYIKVPGYSGADAVAMRAYATRAHEAIGAAAALVACGWIVDLRTNTGGNMWPMLAGLQPLLGDGDLGAFETPAGLSRPWLAGQNVEVEPPATLDLESASVAVLTGPRTASSGEVVTIAFRGRPHTRSFGEPTAGLSTSNRTVILPDGAAIFLTTGIDVDRTGRRYGEKVDPDEQVPASAGAAGGDAAVAAAMRWLLQSSECEQRTQ
jgi:carboxyl-terminal processing protease